MRQWMILGMSGLRSQKKKKSTGKAVHGTVQWNTTLLPSHFNKIKPCGVSELLVVEGSEEKWKVCYQLIK